MNKLIGYLLAAVGIVGLAASYITEVKNFLSLTDLISSNNLMIIGIALVAIGVIFILFGGGSRRKKGTEVPIFQGKDIVGYRRR